MCIEYYDVSSMQTISEFFTLVQKIWPGIEPTPPSFQQPDRYGIVISTETLKMVLFIYDSDDSAISHALRVSAK